MANRNVGLKIVIVISLLANIVLGGFLFIKRQQEEAALEPLSLWLIQGNMGQLERAIQHQQEMGWPNPSHVAEKLDDVLQGIKINLESRKALGKLSNEEERLLWQLYERLSKFPNSSLGYGMNVSEEEKLVLVRLAEQLRSAGWSSGVSFSSSMEQLIERTEILLQSL